MMRLSDKIPVEALEPERVARIEQRVLASFDGLGEAPAPGSWRAFRWLVPAVAVAGVAVAVFLNVRGARRPATTPVVVAQHGPTHVVTGDAPTRMVVGRATIVVAARSEVAVNRTPGGGVSVTVDTGRVDCEVEPRPNRPPFLVHAGQVKVTVVGTIFSVERRPSRKVIVAVTRGKVRVDHAAGAATYVAAGQSWTASRGIVASVVDATSGAAAGAQTPVAPATAPDERTVAIDTRRKARLHKRTSHAPTPGKRTRHASKTGGKPVPTAEKSTTDTDPRSALRTAQISMAPLLSVSATGTRARVAAYRSISVTGRGARAAHALYSLAYQQLFRLGDRHGALKTIGFYQRRFARGRHARDVQWLRIRALCDRAIGQSCRSAAHAYLNRFGSSDERGRLASHLTGWGM